MVIRGADEGAFRYGGSPCVTALPSGRLVAVWAATAESFIGGKPKYKTRVVGAISADSGRTWSKPFTLIDNPAKTDTDPNLILDGKRILVLSTTVPEGFFTSKLPWVSEIWMTFSNDEGETWSRPVAVDKPHKYTAAKRHVGYQLRDGRLAVPYGWDMLSERARRVTEGTTDFVSGLMFSKDGGYHWTAGGDIYARPDVPTNVGTGMDEPAIVLFEDGEIFALLRSGATHLYESRSKDNGATWSKPVPSPLLGFNAPAALWRLRGTNEVVAVWDNNSPLHGRWPIVAAVSRDGCHTWSKPKVIVGDTQESSAAYPSITQASDGTIVVLYYQDIPKKGTDIRWARFNRAWLF